MPKPNSHAIAQRRAIALGIIAVAVLGLILLTGGRSRPHLPPVIARGAPVPDTDPFRFDERGIDDFERRATAGYAHVLYENSPGGAAATARRVARFRPAVERAAKGGSVDPDLLEAVVFLESAGRPEVIAGGDPASASGLTQILAETGSNLLGMRIDLGRSRSLTRRIARAARAAEVPGASERTQRRVGRLLRLRRRIDERFDPSRALEATVRYLTIAKRRLGRDDLAIASYHMGIGNLGNVIRRFGAVPGDPPMPYARIFFASTPRDHSRAYRLLSAFGDDSSTYLWRVLAAREVMALYRSDPGKLDQIEELETAAPSTEQALHPEAGTDSYADPAQLADARARREILPVPDDPQRLGFRVDSRLGAFAKRLGRPRALYRGLRREALAALIYLTRLTRQAGGGSSPLVLRDAVWDRRYQGLLVGETPEARAPYSLHTTGWSFDVARRYADRSQALALQFALDRMRALGLIDYQRESDRIHVTVSADAGPLDALLG